MPAKIKLLVLPSWYPPDGGYFFREHAEALAEEGCEVDVLVNRLTGLSTLRQKDFRYLRSFSIVRQEKIREIRSFMIKLPLADSLSISLWINNTFRHFERYRRRFCEPDLILAHSSIWGGVVAQKIYEKYHIPYIITEHRSRFIQNTQEARDLLKTDFLPLIRRALDDCKKIVCVSSGLKDGLLSLFPEFGEKAVCIPNMVDTGFFRPPAAMKTANEFVFFYAGILEKVKGLDVLLDAFSQVQDEVDSALYIIGSGKLYHALNEKAKKLGLTGRVFFKTDVSSEDLPKYYGACDVFVLPSVTRQEAFGLVLVEAMACAKPVISSYFSGMPYVVGEKENTNKNESVVEGIGGLLVRAGDPEALADALKRILTDSSYAETLGRKGHERVHELFTKDAVCARIRDVYKSSVTKDIDDH